MRATSLPDIMKVVRSGAVVSVVIAWLSWRGAATITDRSTTTSTSSEMAPPAGPPSPAPHPTVPTTAATARAVAAAGAPTFVRVAGNHLVVDGQPFHFVGANLSIMHGPQARASAEEVLAGAARDGVRVGRIWALGEGAADAPPWIREHFLFRAGPHGWIDAATQHLDRVIATAGRVGIRLIITLSNSWSDYGGVPRYLRWAGRWSEGVYGVTDRFYTDRRARAAFRAHVERLLGRTNSLTGVAYRDDPTILAWELMNESTVANAAGAVARRAWIVEMARMIHARAPHHLVTPGVSGYRFERERQDWLRICRLPEVDFCDGHLYPEELLRNRDSNLLDAVLDDYVRLAQTIAGKPFVLGEFGVRGDVATDTAAARGSMAGTVPGLAAEVAAATEERRWQGRTRSWWTTRILERLRGDDAAGGLIWIYQGPRGADGVHGISVGPPGADAGADAIRQAIRVAATAWDRSDDLVNRMSPTVTAAGGEATLMPLHASFEGLSSTVPLLGAGAKNDGVVIIDWNPTAYARADWESSGVYGGGALEHAWGGETGWFEYEYEISAAPPAVAADKQTRQDDRQTPELERGRTPAEITVRARVSSEYPGTLSPPDGQSRFEVSLDGVVLGTAVAPRDDGQGRWVTVNAPASRLRAAAAGVDGTASALAPGRHRLRLTVPPGKQAHGLAIYGRPGAKPVAEVDGGLVELRVRTIARRSRQ